MKCDKDKQLGQSARVLIASCLITLGGCSAWNATPVRMQADYGNSVRNMVNNQIYTPSKAQSPAILAPDGMEGAKAESALEKAYRQDIGKPEVVRQHSRLGTPGSSGVGGGGH